MSDGKGPVADRIRTSVKINKPDAETLTASLQTLGGSRPGTVSIEGDETIVFISDWPFRKGGCKFGEVYERLKGSRRRHWVHPSAAVKGDIVVVEASVVRLIKCPGEFDSCSFRFKSLTILQHGAKKFKEADGSFRVIEN